MNMGKQLANVRAVPAAIIVMSMLGLPGDLTAQDARQVQNVKDFVEVAGASPIELRGYGVVAGLNGNGDSPGGDTDRMIRNFLASGTNHPIRVAPGTVAVSIETGDQTKPGILGWLLSKLWPF